METLFVRDPIFDPDEKIVGYELSHWSDPRAKDSGLAEQVAIGTLLDVGVDSWTGDAPAYLRLSPAMLQAGLLERADPRRFVLMLDSNLQTPDTVRACGRLVEAGYRLGLERVLFPEPHDPLLRLAEVAKVSVRAYSDEQLSRLAGRLRPGPRLLAVGVESARLRDTCLAHGFELFQGYRFTRPDEPAAKREIPVEHIQVFQLMKEVKNLQNPDDKVVEGFQRDVSLTYRLLRLVNSAAVGGRRIDSVGFAIRLLGRDTLYRWLSFLLLAPVAQAGVGAALTVSALRRGRMCELLAATTQRPWAAGSLFIIGLFSQLDLLLGAPVEQLVAEMDFPEDVQRALLHREGEDGAVLALVEAYDDARWDEVQRRCTEMELDPFTLADVYFQSLQWAQEQAPRGNEG